MQRIPVLHLLGWDHMEPEDKGDAAAGGKADGGHEATLKKSRTGKCNSELKTIKTR